MENLQFNFQGVGKQVSSYQADYLVVNQFSVFSFQLKAGKYTKRHVGVDIKVVRNQKSWKWEATTGHVMLRTKLQRG